MGTIVLPDHNLVRHPTIIRRGHTPLLINGGVIMDEGDFKLLVLYRTQARGLPALEVRTYAMSDEDFSRSMLVAAVERLPSLLAMTRMAH